MSEKIKTVIANNDSFASRVLCHLALFMPLALGIAYAMIDTFYSNNFVFLDSADLLSFFPNAYAEYQSLLNSGFEEFSIKYINFKVNSFYLMTIPFIFWFLLFLISISFQKKKVVIPQKHILMLVGGLSGILYLACFGNIFGDTNIVNKNMPRGEKVYIFVILTYFSMNSLTFVLLTTFYRNLSNRMQK